MNKMSCTIKVMPPDARTLLDTYNKTLHDKRHALPCYPQQPAIRAYTTHKA